MKLDTTHILLDWRKKPVMEGEEPARLGAMLAARLSTSPAVPKEQVIRAAALSIKLEAGGEVTLSAADVQLVNKVIAETPGIPPWLIGAVRYLTDPDSLLDDDRASFASVYDAPDAKQQAS